jgi:hypothetical protein
MMAGIYKIYCVGEPGGFMGADGANPIFFQILVGTSDREWLEPHYFDKSIKPLGQIRVLIPESYNSPNALIDACLAFYPKHFESCPSMSQVKEEAENLKRLDFHLGVDDIPKSWDKLRGEAQPLFESLNIWEAELAPLKKNA